MGVESDRLLARISLDIFFMNNLVKLTQDTFVTLKKLWVSTFRAITHGTSNVSGQIRYITPKNFRAVSV